MTLFSPSSQEVASACHDFALVRRLFHVSMELVTALLPVEASDRTRRHSHRVEATFLARRLEIHHALENMSYVLVTSALFSNFQFHPWVGGSLIDDGSLESGSEAVKIGLKGHTYLRQGGA